MIKINKIKKNKIIFFNSFFCDINLFYIDKLYKISKNIKIKIKKNRIYLKKKNKKINFIFLENVFFFFISNILLISIIEKKNKKKFLNLYNKIIKIKIKGILQNNKIFLLIYGLGFKVNIENNQLILKLGFSHNIIINKPKNIKIIKQNNKLIFYSLDYIFLLQFVYYLRSFKKINVYKKKGLLFKNEKIIIKEGKKK